MNRKFRKPPLFARLLLKHLTEYQERYSMAGDMEEAYYEIYEDIGYLRAAFWFWYQTLFCTKKYTGYLYHRSVAMFKNYFKIAFRNLKRYKGYSAINISGLAAGIACCLLILLWVQDELSFDRFHENYDNIYRTGVDIPDYGFFEISTSPFGPAIKKEIPGVIEYVRFSPQTRKVFKFGEKAFYESGGIIADPSLFKVFTFSFKLGDPETAFTDPYNIVITEEFSEKYFGNENPIGKVMYMDGRQVTVTGMIENFPENSHINFDFMSSYEFISRLSHRGRGWRSFNFITYVHLQPGVDIADLENKMTELAAKNNCSQVTGLKWRISLQKFSDAYLYTHIAFGNGRKGNAKIVYIFSVIGFFILVIACVNFMNLSTARSACRAREVGMRKTVGAVRQQIIRQFFGESFFMVILSSTIAILILYTSIPFFNDLIGKQLSINLLNLSQVSGIASIILVTGLLSGCYPALYLSKFTPVYTIKGRGSSKGKFFRKFLVVFQFSFTIILVIGMVVIYRQLDYIRTKELGFNKDNIVYIPLKENIGSKFETFKSEIMKDPSIISVGAQGYLSATQLNRTNNYDWEGRPPDYRIDMFLNSFDHGFLETMGIELAQGSNFRKNSIGDVKYEFILNEEAVRKMGIESPIGKRFSAPNYEGIIIGVIKDVHLKSLYEKIHAHVFVSLNDYSLVPDYGVALIKIDGQKMRPALNTIESVWSEINPVSPFEYSFLDETYNSLYEIEHDRGMIINAFTFIAVFISALGLFGLSSFLIEQRTKEIGIRKALGSSVSSIIIHLNKDFVKWILLANIISWPSGYFIMNKYLEQYAYKIDVGISTFVFSGMVALLIAFITVSYQSIRSANAEPVDSLRYE